MRKKRSSHQSEPPDEGMVNLTPLIDVVFVVLIMFILVAPMLEIDRIQLAQAGPHDDKKTVSVQENGRIAIHVHADNSIWLNGQVVSHAQLLPLLKEAKKKHS